MRVQFVSGGNARPMSMFSRASAAAISGRARGLEKYEIRLRCAVSQAEVVQHLVPLCALFGDRLAHAGAMVCVVEACERGAHRQAVFQRHGDAHATDRTRCIDERRVAWVAVYELAATRVERELQTQRLQDLAEQHSVLGHILEGRDAADEFARVVARGVALETVQVGL
jgi:hypothetical protein